MRPHAHELESRLRSLFCDSLRECASGCEAAAWLSLRGAAGMIDELAAENDAVLTDLEQTAKPKVAVLNRPELVHFATVLGSSDAALRRLLRAVESTLAASYFPLSGIWRSYAAALVNLHRGTSNPVALPKPKGNEKYYLPYIRYMIAMDALEVRDARPAVMESFETRNRDRRFTDWYGLDGDGEKMRRTWHQYYARGGWLPTENRYVRPPAPVLTDWNLFPERLALSPDPQVRLFFSHWNPAQGEWVASGFDPDVRRAMPRGEQ